MQALTLNAYILVKVNGNTVDYSQQTQSLWIVQNWWIPYLYCMRDFGSRMTHELHWSRSYILLGMFIFTVCLSVIPSPYDTFNLSIFFFMYQSRDPHVFLCVYRLTYFVFVSVVCCAGRVHPMPALCRGAIMSGRGAAD